MNQSESSFEEVEVADQSLETSHRNEDNGLPSGDVADEDSSMEEVEVADQSLETSASKGKSLTSGQNKKQICCPERPHLIFCHKLPHLHFLFGLFSKIRVPILH